MQHTYSNGGGSVDDSVVPPLNSTFIWLCEMTEAPWLKDPYWKLKPIPAPLPEEVCQCAELGHLLLRPTVGPNPIDCAVCGNEVDPPERLGLPHQLVDDLAQWREFHWCFYYLWLESGEFENWAKEQLESPNSAVNRRGLDIRRRLGEIRPTFYWWFQDPELDQFFGFNKTRECSVCGNALSSYRSWQACNSCWIVVGS
jgi:hypothetical protein